MITQAPPSKLFSGSDKDSKSPNLDLYLQHIAGEQAFYFPDLQKGRIIKSTLLPKESNNTNLQKPILAKNKPHLNDHSTVFVCL